MTRTEEGALKLAEAAALTRGTKGKPGCKWTWLRYFVYTHDEHDDTVNGDKQFPAILLYRVLIRIILTYDVLFIEKSRQIMMTWLMAAISLHEILFKKNRRICFQNINETKAGAMVKRSRHIYSHIYEDDVLRTLLELPEPNWNKGRAGTDSMLEIPANNSMIQSAAQGGDIFSSFTFSWVFADEISKQTQAEEGYNDAMPTVDRGGKYIGPSTPNGKVFNYRMLHGVDERGKHVGKKVLDSYNVEQKRYSEEELLAMPNKDFDKIPIEVLVACVPGMRFWIMEMPDGRRTPCLRIHYDADPNKRTGTPEGAAWYKQARPRYSTQRRWDREQEIKYGSAEGRAVISNWSDRVFINDQIEYDPKEILGIGVDFGTEVCGAVFGQKHKIEGYNFYQGRFFNEIILRGSNTFALRDSILEMLKNHFPEALTRGNVRVYPDYHGGNSPSSTSEDGYTDIEILEAAGLHCVGRKVDIRQSTEFVEGLFEQSSPQGDPGFLIHPRCDYIISCLEGGWHFPDKPIGQGDGKPEKDGEFDHGGDEVRYWTAHTFDVFEMEQDRDPIPEIVPIRQWSTGRIVGYEQPNRRRQNLARGIH